MSARTTRLLAPTAVTTGLLLLAAGPAVASSHGDDVAEPDSFTSMFSITGSPDLVVGGGEPGATSQWDLRLNSDEEIICYDITLTGVTPPYQSAALTATHIHEGAPGVAGPPRVVFQDPQPQDDGTLRSSGCVQGPFVTGVGPESGGDHGDGFSLAEIEADPDAYYVDTHTTEYVAGAVRGQFGDPMPVGGVETGGGDGAATSNAGLLSLGLLSAAGALGALGWRRFATR